MKWFALLLVLIGCDGPTFPSTDCEPEKARVRFLRGEPDSVALYSNGISHYEQWFYRGSELVETFSWGGDDYCLYDQERRPDWLLPVNPIPHEPHIVDRPHRS